MRLSSQAFDDGDRIPRGYAEGGLNLLPPLAIADVPPGTRSLALVIEDPDSPLGAEVTHWLAWNIPPDTRHLDARHLPTEYRVGTDSFGEIGYTGPNPPEGRHRYRFHLLALDKELALETGAARPAFERAVKDHILAEAELTGIYEYHMNGSDRG